MPWSCWSFGSVPCQTRAKQHTSFLCHVQHVTSCHHYHAVVLRNSYLQVGPTKSWLRPVLRDFNVCAPTVHIPARCRVQLRAGQPLHLIQDEYGPNATTACTVRFFAHALSLEAHSRLVPKPAVAQRCDGSMTRWWSARKGEAYFCRPMARAAAAANA